MSAPANGTPLSMTDGKLQTPDNPIIPFIEGDGTGPDIWRASQRVIDAAVEKAYGGSKKIEWMEVLAGQKAFDQTGEWLPEATLEAFPNLLGRYQGTSNNACRWRHPFLERSPASNP